MKARVKATGEIVEVIAVGTYINEFGTLVGDYKTVDGIMYASYDLDFYIEEGITIPDYWTRLEHQAAIAVMQGMVSNSEMFIELGNKRGLSVENAIAEASIKVAHALVEKMKEEMK